MEKTRNISRRWDELPLEMLALIFTSVSVYEKLMVIPRVCKEWNQAVLWPCCWQDIDIITWNIDHEIGRICLMLKKLVARSNGATRRLSFNGRIEDEGFFTFIADNARFLETLRLPSSRINDVIVENIAERLSNIKVLDISYCESIGANALETIGKNCRKLIFLMRNQFISNICSGDDEALAVATTMPNLVGLEIRYRNISTRSFIEILEGCKMLKTIDITGCRKVESNCDHLVRHYGFRMRSIIIYDDLCC